MNIPEKQIENSILHWLTLHKIFCWKNQSTGVFDPVKKTFRRSMNRFHIKGAADILGILDGGRMLAIEVKSKVGRVSPHQKTFIDEINIRGGVAFVARSIEDVEKNLKGYVR